MAAGNGREGEAGDGGAPKLHREAFFERGLLGLAATSTAITLAVSEPPPWLDRNASVALSGLFFAGMAQAVAASVWAPAAGGGGVAGRKLVMYGSLAVAAGIAAAASLLL